MDFRPPTDEETLARFGYRQQLRRSLGSFSNFAVTFSIVSITTGIFANYGNGLKAAGPAFVWTWLIVGTGQTLVMLVFAQLARQIPISGYAYHWTRQLVGPRWAWWAGWLMILQMLTGMPGACYAFATYIAPYLGIGPANRNVVLMTITTLVVIAAINHFGIRIASFGNNLTVLAEVGGSGLAGILLLGLVLHRHTHSWRFLTTHPGQPAGLPYLGAFAFSSLMSAYTLTGFEHAANLAEETHQPHSRVPGIILFSVFLAVALGFLVLLGFTLAIPDVGMAADDPTPLLSILGHYFPPLVTNGAMLLVFVAMFGSSLAGYTSLARMTWSMARDGELPASAWLAQVSSRRVPANAIWTVAVLTSLFVFWAKVEVIITGIATLAGYLTYAVVVAATLANKPRNPQHGSKEDSAKEGIRPNRALSLAALLWLLLLLGMIGLPRSGWTGSVATGVALAVGGVWLVFRKKAD